MAYVREETINRFTDEELIQMFRQSLDELGIAYEEGPGDWSGFLRLDPADFDAEECEESYTIQTSPSGRGRYRVKAPADYHVGLTFNVDSSAMAAALGLGINHKPEDGPLLAAA